MADYGLFDTHVHLDDERYDTDREELIAALPSLGVARAVNIGANMETSYNSVELSNKYDFIYASVGVHPHDSIEMRDEDMDTLTALCRDNKKVVAIGEIGLDYHYDNSPRDVQRKRFSDQMALARELEMPVVLHIREAYEDALEILKFYGKMPANGVVHCFSGSLEFAREVLKLGYKIGIGGVLTFSNAKKLVGVAREVDIKDILIETDCPYMAPTPFRGQRNDPAKVWHVADKLSDIKEISVDEIIRITYQNGNEFYRISD